MAHKRMFSKDITESDAFADMPLSTQALYFHLGMSADDDGFVNNAKKIQRGIGASPDDLNLLIAKKFLIKFESGVVVIKHWRINNAIRNDRKNDTKYSDEMEQLYIQENGSYSLTGHRTNLLPTIAGDRCEKHNVPIREEETGMLGAEQAKDCLVGICRANDGQMTGKCPSNVGIDIGIGIGIGEDRDILSGKPDCLPVKVREIIDYLNSVLGTSYRASSKKNTSLINARLNDGFTVDDFKAVIDKKAAAWRDDPKMAKYLRPETLFGTKFEGYLNELTAEGVHGGRYSEYD